VVARLLLLVVALGLGGSGCATPKIDPAEHRALAWEIWCEGTVARGTDPMTGWCAGYLAHRRMARDAGASAAQRRQAAQATQQAVQLYQVQHQLRMIQLQQAR
jgi:hypothetical protein